MTEKYSRYAPFSACPKTVIDFRRRGIAIYCNKSMSSVCLEKLACVFVCGIEHNSLQTK